MRIALTLLAICCLAACGFEPVHSVKSKRQLANNSQLDLTAIAISVDRSRLGQLLKAEIADRIHPRLNKAPKRYRLSIALHESEASRFIRQDGTAARGDFVYTSNFTLTDITTKKMLDSGSLTRTSSYNISESADYATYVTLEDARKRGVVELARSYALRLSNLQLKTP